MAALLTIVPVGLVLGLIMFGTYGTHRPPAITPGRVIPVVLMTVVLGPVAVSAFGFFGWLIVLFVLVAAILMVAVLRNPPRPLRH
jgi:hypothetical protein